MKACVICLPRLKFVELPKIQSLLLYELQIYKYTSLETLFACSAF